MHMNNGFSDALLRHITYALMSILIIGSTVSLALASEERPDAYSEWDETSTFTTTGTAVARVVDHYMNMDSNKIETLTVDIYTERNENNPELKVTLTETNVNTGIFEGTIFFSDTKKSLGNTLQVKDGDVVSVEYTYSQVPGSDKLENMIGVGQEKTIQNSQRESESNDVSKVADKNTSLTHDTSNLLNEEKIKWLESSYPATGTGVVRVVDPDMNLDPDKFDNFDVDVWSDSDLAGIDLTLTETNIATGIFEGTVFFSTNDESSGHRLRVAEGETITAKYEDSSLPDLHTTPDDLDVISTASIQGIYNPDKIYNRITLDRTIYTWTDKVYITIDASEHNFDGNKIEDIGNSDQYPVKVATRHFDLDNYRLVETGTDTGIFTGEVILTGFAHDADGNAITGIDGNDVEDINPRGDGPVDGLLPADNEDGITVSFEHTEDQTAISSALIQWNEGKTQWLKGSYPDSGTGVVRVIDPDMNWDPEAVDNFDVDVWSDSDASGIDLTVTETNENTGIFEGTVFFSTTDDSSGHRLRAIEGDTITAEYEDNTLPSPYTPEDELDVTDTAIIRNTGVPSPYKQMKNGVMAEHVICNGALEKTYKSDGHPACVKPSSVEKLVQRGWMNSNFDITVDTPALHVTSNASEQSKPYAYEDVCGFPVTDEMRLNAIYEQSYRFTREGIPYFELNPGNFTYVKLAENYDLDDPHLEYWFVLENRQKEIGFRIGACDIDGSSVSLFEKRN